MKKTQQTNAFFILLVVLIGFGGATVSAQTLDECTSDTFNGAKCERELDTLEQHYRPSSIPFSLIESVAAAYHNLAYVSPDGPIKTKWQQKWRELYDSAVHRATSSVDWYMVSRIAVDQERRIEFLKKAISVDPENLIARHDLFSAYIRLHSDKEALAQWQLLRASRGFRPEDYRVMQCGLVNMLVTAGQNENAKEIANQLVIETRSMDTNSRCYLFRGLNTTRLQLATTIDSEIQRTRAICANVEHRNRGVLALQQGDKERAVQEFETQIRENPRYLGAYLLLEQAYRSSNNTAKGLEVVRRLFEADISEQERCSGASNIPLSVYASLDAKLEKQIRTECGR